MWLISGVPSAAVAVVLGGVLLYFGARFPVQVRVILGVTAVVFIAAAAYAFILWEQAWEYRLDDQTLEFRRPLDRGWATIQLDQIAQVGRVEGLENNWGYEIAFPDGRRVGIEKDVFGKWPDFQQALSSVRPEIHFVIRPANQCPSCGGDLHRGSFANAIYTELVSRRCDACGAKLGRRLKRIPSGGIMLPEGLES
jgi:hypothetical protein